MNNFDKLDLYVAPIEDATFKRPSLNGKPLAWSDRKNWCSWQERETIYPDIQDWYVIPPSLATYIVDGIEVGYWVLDIDNHDGDRFSEAIDFLKTCGIPPSLTIRTPSGGLHIYYRAIKEDIPKALTKSDLPIEIKSTTGVVAPNGRDRVIIRDLPVAFYTIEEGSPIASLARIKNKVVRKPKKPVNPDYQLPAPLALKESNRHDTMLKKAKWLQDDGCPDEKVYQWLVATRELSPGTRRITDKELHDMVDWVGSGVDDDLAELLEPKPTQTPSTSPQNAPQAPSAPKDDTDIITKVETALGGHCVPLKGIASVFAQALFEGDGHKIIRDTADLLDNISDPDDWNPQELNFLIDIVCASNLTELKQTWDSGPTFLQCRYVMFKDTIKLGLEKLGRN